MQLHTGRKLTVPPTKSVNQMRQDDRKKLFSTIGKGSGATLPKKDTILTQGDAADAVFHIREGRLRLRLTRKVKQSHLEELIQNLSLLISEMLELEASGLIGATEVHPDHQASARATQVLESLAKNGIPSRAEITDAAMGEGAECVMLNKGPYIVSAVRNLGDILRRMQPFHEKKNSLLRKLHLAVAFQPGS